MQLELLELYSYGALIPLHNGIGHKSYYVSSVSAIIFVFHPPLPL